MFNKNLITKNIPLKLKEYLLIYIFSLKINCNYEYIMRWNRYNTNFYKINYSNESGKEVISYDDFPVHSNILFTMYNKLIHVKEINLIVKNEVITQKK